MEISNTRDAADSYLEHYFRNKKRHDDAEVSDRLALRMGLTSEDAQSIRARIAARKTQRVLNEYALTVYIGDVCRRTTNVDNS